MRTYKTTRTVLAIIEIVAWGVVVIGGFAALAGASGGANLLGSQVGAFGALPGIIICFIGLLVVIFVQMGRAQVDTAHNTGELLRIALEQQTGAGVRSLADVVPSAQSVSPNSVSDILESEEYEGDNSPDKTESTKDANVEEPQASSEPTAKAPRQVPDTESSNHPKAEPTPRQIQNEAADREVPTVANLAGLSGVDVEPIQPERPVEPAPPPMPQPAESPAAEPAQYTRQQPKAAAKATSTQIESALADRIAPTVCDIEPDAPPLAEEQLPKATKPVDVLPDGFQIGGSRPRRS